jgi:diguanylate cyclase
MAGFGCGGQWCGGVSSSLVLFGLISAEAFLAGLLALGLLGFGMLAWWHQRQAAVASAAPKADVPATVLQLDKEAAAVLSLVRDYLDAGERYSVTLAQAGERLPKTATADEIGIIVKFLLAENAKMQHETRELKGSLEQSQSQIDSLRCHLAEAREIGMRDSLTSLSNRRHFDDSLTKAVANARARGSSLSLAMADIDNFKKVNDLFGHRVGDEILKTFARVLLDNARAEDTVARYGGEEFAIILPATRIEYARELTERMRSQLEALQLAISASGRELGSITASFGIAELGAADDADALLHRADARLYEAKCAGRNRVAADREIAA